MKGARVIPLCYHGQRKEILPRPLSSLEALDLSEPDDVRKLLNLIAKEVGLRAPDIDPNGLIVSLPSRNYEEQDADGKLPDIRVEIEPATVLDGQGKPRHFLCLKAQNHDKNSVFLGLPSIAIKNSRTSVTIILDSATHLPVPTGELKPGDSRSVHFDPTPVEMEDIEQWGEVIFCDKIGREFKGSAAATSEAIQFWKALVGL